MTPARRNTAQRCRRAGSRSAHPFLRRCSARAVTLRRRVEPTHRPRRRSGCVRWRSARNHSARREVARGDTTGLLPEPCASAASTRRATRFATVAAAEVGPESLGCVRASTADTAAVMVPRRSPESAPSDAPAKTAAPDTVLRNATGDASATRRSLHRDRCAAQSEASVDASPPFNRGCACAGTGGEDHEAEERCTDLRDTPSPRATHRYGSARRRRREIRVRKDRAVDDPAAPDRVRSTLTRSAARIGKRRGSRHFESARTAIGHASETRRNGASAASSSPSFTGFSSTASAPAARHSSRS